MKPLKATDREATYVAMEAAKRSPIRIEAAESEVPREGTVVPQPLATTTDGRKPPPRLRKPSPGHDRCLAPTADLESHRARLREAFGNTLSDEFVEVLLGKLIETLRPNPFDQLQEPTLNAALALIDSLQPRSEMEALMAVQIVATGLSGLRFLRQSQHHMDESFIDIYGGYAIKLIKLQNELLQTLDRNRRGHKQTVQARDVHIHSGAQGVVGIINSGKDGSGGQDGGPTPDSSPQPKSEHDAKQAAHAPHPALRSPDAERDLVPSAGDAERPMSDARRTVAGSPEGK
jgi:hypothetical protein